MNLTSASRADSISRNPSVRIVQWIESDALHVEHEVVLRQAWTLCTQPVETFRDTDFLMSRYSKNVLKGLSVRPETLGVI